MSNTGQYDSVMHVIADELLEHFDFTGAINYLEQTFESKDDPSKSFVLTMQMLEGLTPCEKLFAAEQRIAELEKELNDYKVALCEYANQLCKIKDVVSGFNNGIQILACDGMVHLTLSEYNALVSAINATE